MKIAAAGAVVFAFVALGSPARADDMVHFSRSLKLPAGGTVRLRGFAGHVTVTAGDRDDVAVEATRHGSRDWLDRTQLEMYTEGDAIVIKDDQSTHSNWFWSHSSIGSTDFEIKVPRKTNLDVHVFSAPVTIDGVEGTYKVHAFSARIRISNAAGSVQAHTFSGSVEIHAARWMEPETIDVDTFSGSVELRVPGDARGALTFNSFSGRLNSDVPLMLHTSGHRSVSAELGNGGSASSLRVKTFSGSLRIDR